MDRRYQVGVFGGCAAIVSPVSLTADCGITLPARRYTYFGKNQPLPMPQGTFHRYRYSTADAKAICDWLNERESAKWIPFNSYLWWNTARWRGVGVMPWPMLLGRDPDTDRVSDCPMSGPHRLEYSSADWELVETELRGGTRV